MTAKKTKEEEIVTEGEAAEEAAKPAKKIKRNSVSIEFSRGVRTFSREIHGDDFEEIAAEFSATHDGKEIEA